MSTATRPCAHCGLPTAAPGEPPFCCTGCEAVYRLLHEEGLDTFYRRLAEAGSRPEPVSAVAEVAPLSEGEVEVVRQGGRAAATAAVEGITCAACVWLLERGVGRLPGVHRFAVNFATHRAQIEWQPEAVTLEAIDRRVRALGYALRPVRAADGRRLEGRWLARLGVAAFGAMNVMLLSVGLYAGYFQGISAAAKRGIELLEWALATPVLFYAGSPFWAGAWRGLKGRALTMDLLVVLGAGLAYGHSVAAALTGRGETYFDSVVMIVALLLAGRFLEHRARARASRATDRLAALLPATARLWREGGWVDRLD
ncbi:MAG: heavy metal translocating P-type ATPase, partial [Nitrospirae bacterium]